MLQPFFLRNVHPNHLRNITHIQLGYDEKTVACTTFTSIHISEHCAPCNMERWLTLIRKELTGLRKIDVFLYLDLARFDRFGTALNHVRQPWVHLFLALQHSPHGLRELQAHIRACPETTHAWRREEIEELFRWVIEVDRQSKSSLSHLPTLPHLCRFRAAETAQA